MRRRRPSRRRSFPSPPRRRLPSIPTGAAGRATSLLGTGRPSPLEKLFLAVSRGPRTGRLADSARAGLGGSAPAPAHPVNAVLAVVRIAPAVAGTVHAALAGTAGVGAALGGAGLTDRVAERLAGAGLAAQALGAVAGVHADPAETALARGAGAGARSVDATRLAQAAVARALADTGGAGLALAGVAGTAGAVQACLTRTAARLAGPVDAVLAGSASAPARSTDAGLAKCGITIGGIVVDDAVAVVVHSVAHLGGLGRRGIVHLVEHRVRRRHVDPARDV